MAERGKVKAAQVIGLFLLFSTSCASALPEDNSDEFIIREPSKILKASRLIVTEKPDQITFLKDAGSIGTDEISSVIALALGFSSFKDLSWSGLLAGNLFNRPKANILITVDGVKEGDKIEIPEVASFPVKQANNVDTLDEIMGFSTLENLPTHVSAMYGGKSFSLSLSADNKLAFSGYSASPNSKTMYWSEQDEAFKLAESAEAGVFSDMSLNKDEIVKAFSKADLGEGVKYSAKDGVFVVSLGGQDKAVFDIHKKEDFLLFAELQAFQQAYQALAKMPAVVRDSYPDLLSFSVSSLKSLRRRYGDESLQVRGALKVLSNVIPRLSKQFSDLYNGKALVEVLLLEDEGSLKDKYPSDTASIYKVVENHLDAPSLAEFHDSLPSIRLRRSLEDHVRSSLCSGIQSRLVALHSRLQVSCDESVIRRVRRESATTAPTTKPADSGVNLASSYSEDYPVIFNITLWLMILLVLAVYIIALVLWYMDPGRDSIIYRMTNQRIKTD